MQSSECILKDRMPSSPLPAQCLPPSHRRWSLNCSDGNLSGTNRRGSDAVERVPFVGSILLECMNETRDNYPHKNSGDRHESLRYKFLRWVSDTPKDPVVMQGPSHSLDRDVVHATARVSAGDFAPPLVVLRF
ncbi:hypothetical protein CDAR_497491 [Caerostris darwini]|uniref:Uncharacterized protein n=1 Tax=Caerostris darwini TaxID=1538125 RepID=A0AAV4S2P3_9ARAC|nr:hypothetical protein CDAR_497491 [Caerostris darwini]